MEPFPASPEPEYRPDAKGPAPASVSNAVRLIWLGVAIGLVSTVLSLLFIDDYVQQIRDQEPSLTESQARAAFYLTLAITTVFTVALTALFAYFIGKGANWARIVYTVLGVLGLLFTLPALGNQPVLFAAFTLAGLVITVITIVLLFRADSNRYFKAA
jgi:hypothetical protein